MSRRRIAAAAVAALLLMGGPAHSGNRTDSSGGTYRIIVPIDVFADDPSLAKKWTEAIEDFWNNPSGLKRRWRYCGQKVQFVPDIEVFPRGAAGRPDTHDILVKLVPPGVDFTSNVKRKTRTFDPSQNSTGVWASNESDATIAHEFGHFLGLPDEYVVVSKDPRRTKPGKGFEGSLMAEPDGLVSQRLIDEAMANNKVRCERWSVLWVDNHTVAGFGVVSRSEGTLEVTVSPEGRVSGKGSITQTTEGGSAPFSATIGGTRGEDAFRLKVKGPGGTAKVTAPIQGTSAEGKYRAGGGGTTYNLTLIMECLTCEGAD